MVEHVATVEGNPLLKDYIEGVHRANGVSDRVTFYSGIAIPAPTMPTMTFYLRQDFWASSLDGKKWKYVDTVEVQTLDLNALVSEHRPTILVIDIEGGESGIFENASLGGVKRIMMELHQEVIGRNSVKEMFDQLSERGFHYDQDFSCSNQLVFSHISLPL